MKRMVFVQDLYRNDREGSVRKTQFEINGHSVDFTPNGLK